MGEREEGGFKLVSDRLISRGSRTEAWNEGRESPGLQHWLTGEGVSLLLARDGLWGKTSMGIPALFQVIYVCMYACMSFCCRMRRGQRRFGFFFRFDKTGLFGVSSVR